MAGFNDLKKKYHIQEKETKTKTYTLDDGKKYKVNVLGTDDAAKVGSNKFRSERFETLIKEKKNNVQNNRQQVAYSGRYDSKKGKIGYSNYLKTKEPKSKDIDFGNLFALAGYSTGSNEALPNISEATYGLRQDTSYKEPGEDWLDEEKNIFGYLWENDRAAAEKYATEVNNAVNRYKKDLKAEKVAEYSTENFGQGILASVSSIASNAGSGSDYLADLVEYNARGVVTEKEDFLTPYEYTQAVRGSIASDLNEYGTILGKGLGDAYQIGMSAADSFVYGRLGISDPAFFGIGATAAMNEARERRVSENQAFAYGLTSGIMEAVFEHIGIDNMLKMKSPHTLSQAFKGILKQSGVEALEEMGTELTNTAWDAIINMDKSEFVASYANYISEGKGRGEALARAFADLGGEVLWAGISGALSGTMTGTAQIGFAKTGEIFGDAVNKADARKAVKDLGKDRDAVLDYAMETEEGSEVRKAAEDIRARTERGKKVSNKEYADVLLKTDDNFAKAEIKRQLEAEAMSTGEEVSDEQLDSMSTAVLKTIKGKMVSKQENAQIEQSQSAKNVYARNTGRDYTYGEGLSEKEARTLKESRDKQIISEYAEDQDEKYAKELTDAYVEYYAQNDDNRALLDVESFAEMFGSFYESGKVGYTSVDKALNTYKNIDTNLKNAFSKAYELGKADLEADNVAQNEFRQAAAKKGVEGKIVFEGEARKAAKNKLQTTALEFMGRVLKKSYGIEYHVFASYILDKDLTYTNKEGETVELKAGSRVYKDRNGEIVSAPSGFYDAESRQIWVDLNAGAEGIGLMLDTLTHEHVHDIRVWSYEHYKQLLDITKESIEAKGVDFDDVVAEMYDLYHNKKDRKDYTIEKAKEEVVAKTMSGLLRDENGLREFSQQVYAKDKTLWEKIKDWFADVVARLTNAYKDVDLDSALAQNLKDQKELYEKAQKIFAEAVVQAGQNYKAVESGAFKGLYKTTEGNSDVYVTEKGNVIAVSEKGNANNVMYNIGEYDNGGRDYLENWLTKAVKKRDVSQTVKDQMLQAMDNAAELVRDLEKSFPVFKEWGEVSLAYDDSGKPIMRCKVKNGDYEINFDFSTVCKKRKGLDAVLNNLIKTGKIDLIDLSRSDIQFINETLNKPKYNFEIACALCFVDSKRYRVGEWASGAATMYNDLINSLVKPEDLNKISSFNFGGNENKNIIEGDISTWDDSRLDFSTLKEILASDSRAGGMGYKKAFAKLIIENPKYRKFLSSSDIVSSRGTDRMRNEANDLLEAVNAIGGSSKPKMSNSESVWDHSILMDRRVTAKSSFAMGGARTQSFSDFIATMFFDYCQMFAEAQAKKLPMQAYTKELAFAELFGLTGARINLSVLHGVKISAEDRAWLDSKYVVNKDGELELNITTKADKERLEAIKRNAGLDENGNYVPEKQSIDFDKAVNLQNRDGYSRYLGTIVVGVSERHIWKLLDDMRVRMIIPYHKSGLSPVIAKARNIDCYTDFTLSQNTRLGESWGEDAGKTIGSTSLSDEGNKRLKAIKDAGKKWDFYSVLHKYEKDWDTATNSWKEGTNHAETITYELSSNGKNVFQNDPMRQTCEDYFVWCKHFDMIPQFDQFMKHPNYYKMQEDFDVYDCITGEYVPQTAVEFKLPDNAREVLGSELEAQQETSDRLNKAMPKMVDEIVNTIGRKIPPEIKIGKMMDERDSDGNILSPEQAEFFKNSKMRDENGNLKVMHHGTDKAGFTVFDPSYSDDKISLFFTDSTDVAGSYSDKEKDRRHNPYKKGVSIKTKAEFDNLKQNYTSEKISSGHSYEINVRKVSPKLKEEFELDKLSLGGVILRNTVIMQSLAHKYYALMDDDYENADIVKEGLEVLDQAVENIKSGDPKQFDKNLINILDAMSGVAEVSKFYYEVILDDDPDNAIKLKNVSVDMLNRKGESWDAWLGYEEREEMIKLLDANAGKWVWFTKVSDGKLLHGKNGIGMDPEEDADMFGIEEEVVKRAIKFGEKYGLLQENGNRYDVYLNITNPYIYDGESKFEGTLRSLDINLNWDDTVDVYMVKDKYGKSEYVEHFFDAYELEEFIKKTVVDEDMKAEILETLEEDGEGSFGDVPVKVTLNDYWSSLKGPDGTKWNTRKYTQYAKDNGYDGIIFKGIHDNGGRSHFDTADAPSTIAVAFDSNQVKDIDNKTPTTDPDIRYDERNWKPDLDKEEWQIVNYVVENHQGKKLSPKTDYFFRTKNNKSVFGIYSKEDDVLLYAVHKTQAYDEYDFVKYWAEVTKNDNISKTDAGRLRDWLEIVRMRYNRHINNSGKPAGAGGYQGNVVVYDRKHRFNPSAALQNVLNNIYQKEIVEEDLSYDERIETFDDQILTLERQNKKLVKEMENLMSKYEAAQDRAKKNILAGQMAQGKKDAEQLRKTTEKYQSMVAARDQKLDQQSKDFKEALKAKDKESKLAQDYAMAEGVLAGQMAQGAEDAKVIREIEGLLQKKKAELKKVRERRDEILEEKRQAYAAYREKTRESIASGGLKKSIEKNAKTLYEWLMKNSDKEHVPEVLKTTVGDFLESIDFTSKRGLAGGEATKKDQAFAKRLNNLASMLEKQRNYMNKANDSDAENPLDCFLDLPEGFAEEIRKLADDVAKTAIGGNFVVNEMNSAQLAQLNQALRVLKTSISKMNKLITNAHFASVTEAARSSMLEMAEYKAHKPMNDISEQADKMLKWEMFTPVYAFKRYGSAGESIFKGIQKGWSDFAFAVDKVLKFAEGTYTDKEVEAWGKETHSIKLSDGNTVTLTTAQLMSLYCLNKREQARGHIYGGGIRIADIKEGKVKIQQTEPYLVSFEDVETLISELTDRQIDVADKLQKFMTEQGSEWGNKVSMERFGYRAFTEDNYFPIESDANNLIAIDPEAKANDMFRLLNMSATKSLTKGANNAIVISDIFDIFSNHMSDMAKYGTLALPILDTMKWYNYKVRYDVGDGQFRTETVQKSVERAYGKAGKSYFTTFMKDLNGVKEGGRGEGFARKMVSNYKIASVGANIRVALLQPTSIVRASMEIEPKYILQALTKLPAAKKAESKSGIALWKALGFYNTDIARGVREQIKGGGKTIDKIRDKSMILAEQMDRITFGTLWNAAEAKAKDLGYSGNEIEAKTVEIFDEIIYKTQVVDSTLTRSSLMRSNSMFVSSTMAFMAEPTLSYNIVAETVFDMAKEKDFATGWKKQGKKFEKAIAVYAASSLAAAIIESIPDAIRDDDDDEWFGQKWWQAFWGERFWDGNLVSEFNILEKIPLLKDFISLRKGYDLQRLDAAWLSSLNKAFEIDQELINVYIKGEKPTQTTYWGKMTGYGAAYANLRALSQIAGLPVSNTVRDVVAIWNTIVGRMAPSLKLKTYDDSKKK